MSMNIANNNSFSECSQKPVLQVANLRIHKPSTTCLPQISIIPIAVCLLFITTLTVGI